MLYISNTGSLFHLTTIS